MRLAKYEEVNDIVDIYNSTIEYANTVGRIDWVYPFPTTIVESLIDRQEMYCWENKDAEITGLAKITLKSSESWTGKDVNRYLYLGKLALNFKARKQNYVGKKMLPEIEENATNLGLDGVRLTCLKDNYSLANMYRKLGFEEKDCSTVFSPEFESNIEIINFQKTL